MAIKGDFISFTYNGVHSTDLGIVRVSSSDRYNDQLTPTSKDKTVEVPGGNGTYFFGSYYTQRAITLNVAFDEVTEEQIRLMRRTFGDRKIHQLIFDDEPYKVYYAVVNNPIINYIPFGSPRIYKGDGTFNFVCYDPFAHCPNAYKKLNNWSVGNPIWYKYDNKDEWNLSALLIDNNNIDVWDSVNKQFLLYNPGDIETDYMIYVPIKNENSNNNTFSALTIKNGSTLESQTLLINQPIELQGEDTHICFNSKTNLLEGFIFDQEKGYQKTSNIYNAYLGSNTWPKIPQSFSTNWELELTDYNGSGSGDNYTMATNEFILRAGENSNTFITTGNIVTSIILRDSVTNEVLLASIEVLGNKVTVSLEEPAENNIIINITSIVNNPAKPFIEYDYLYC